MSALIIGRNKVHEFLAPACHGHWFQVVPDIEDDTQFRAVIVVLSGPNAESRKNFLRDNMREDRNQVGRLARWVEYLAKEPNTSVYTVGVDCRFGGAVVFHKPSGEIEVVSAPFCIGRLGDEFDAYIVQRGMDNCFRQVVDQTQGDDDEAIQNILEQLIESGALKGYAYVYEYH